MAVTELLLVRHGETDWNRLGLLQGTRDIPLNDRGRQQASELAARVSGGADAVYSSPLVRARSTAEIIAVTAGADVEIEPDLRELCYGFAQGKTVAWLRRHDPALEYRWRTTPWQVRFSGGDTLRAVRARAAEALSRIVARHHGERVALCAHGHVNRVLMITALAWPRNAFWHIEQPNGAVQTLRCSKAGWSIS